MTRATPMTLREKSTPEIVCLVDDGFAMLRSIGRLHASDGEFLGAVRTALAMKSRWP